MTDKDRREIAQLRGVGMGYGRIARQLGIPLSTVKSYCLRNNVASGGERRVCIHCGKEFHGRSGRKYCSHQCYIEERFGGKDDSANATA